MHVFDHTIKPILLYGCEVWGMFNPFTSEFRNTLLNFSRIFDKLPAEKLHHKFCIYIYILGVHSKTSNTAVLSELGRFPIYFNIVKALDKYYYRLKNIQSEFPVLHDASSHPCQTRSIFPHRHNVKAAILFCGGNFPNCQNPIIYPVFK